MVTGKLIVIEGIDGSGKHTQTKALSSYLSQKNINNESVHFPQYSKSFFGQEIGHYLDGKFGGLDEIHPKLTSMLYAGDRYEKKRDLYEKLEQGVHVICDRYVPSNIAHNSVKLKIEEQRHFENWLKELEYEVYGLPKPNIIIFLDMPPNNAEFLVLEKDKREYTEKKQDLHEADQDYMTLVYSKFKEIASEEKWIQIPCIGESRVREISEITNEIINVLNPLI